MRIGLFIGRFQPLHKGHVLIIKKCGRQVDRLVIGLGSSNAELACKNPFTAGERREMIRRGMKEAGVRNYAVAELPDFKSDAEWVKEVLERVRGVAPTPPNLPSGRGGKIVSPPFQGGVRGGPASFDLAWSGSEWVQRVFKEEGLPIEPIKEFPGLSATKIRRKMSKGLPWLKYVPLSVRKYLREIGAVKRVRTLCSR
ncbi:adenylyltransferase/cytidyltransferase family protein [Candidatus Uhrbacteria bacterium]|nr:adenylyltransferase/cytidyltransferase family protein [Candidatus Uhrbacteria bacterium]